MRNQHALRSGSHAVCVDSRHGGEHRHIDISAHAFAQRDQYRFAAAIEKTWGLAGESGTLESSRVLENERLPQKLRLFKFLEGDLLLPSTLLDQLSPKRHQ